MNKKLTVLMLCVVVVSVIATTSFSKSVNASYLQKIITAFLVSPTPPHQLSSIEGQTSRQIQKEADARDVAIYGHLFDHIALLRKQAEEASARGEDGSQISALYKNAAGLSEQQAVLLEQIALECKRNVEIQDGKAAQVIRKFRADTEKLKQKSHLPRLPAELGVLQEGLHRIILQHRDQLHSAFGNEEFKRFDGFLKNNVRFNAEKQEASPSKTANNEAIN